MNQLPSSWPFTEAKSIKLDKLAPDRPVIFQTGFGPSGRPHIGTFAEVARTIMVKNAFAELHPERASRLFVFCDDMDGLRKVPANLPDPEMLCRHIGKPLCKIPDPFGTDESYAAHMERELVEFLSRFGFEFELKCSVREYEAGVFNEALHRVLERYDEVRNLILPTLGEENREQWSPIIPACEKCGRLYTTIVTGRDPARDTVTYECRAEFGTGEGRVAGCGHGGEVSVLDGKVKVGWKVDWAIRWFTYGVAYEMFGKDLIESAKLSGKICRVLGAEPPAGMVYELFLDESGKKISKSVGEGLTVEAWMKYAPLESLFFFLFPNPKKQRRLYFEVIPKSVDDYLDELRRWPGRDESEKMNSVLWHLEKINRPPPAYASPVNFSLVLNLIAAIGAGDPKLLLDYLRRYDPQADQNREVLDRLVERAISYHQDFIEPKKKYRQPEPHERRWFELLRDKLAAREGGDEDAYQALVFEAARECEAEAKEVFRAFYQVVLGQERGPRFGTLTRLVGKDRVLQMLADALAGTDPCDRSATENTMRS